MNAFRKKYLSGMARMTDVPFRVSFEFRFPHPYVWRAKGVYVYVLEAQRL